MKNEAKRQRRNLLRQFVGLLLLVSLLFLSVITLNAANIRRVNTTNTGQLAQRTIGLLNGKVGEILLRVQNEMSVVAYNPTVYSYYTQMESRPMERGNLSDVLTNSLLADDNVAAIALLDGSGAKMLGVGARLDGDYTGEPVNYIQFHFEPFKDSKGAYYTILYPIFDLKNTQYFTKIGYCRYSVRTRELENLINEYEITPNTRLLLVDASGAVIAGNIAAENVRTLVMDDSTAAARGKTPGEEAFCPSDEDYAVYTAEINKSGWRIVGAVPRREMGGVFALYDQRLIILYFFSFSVLMFMGFFCYWMIIRPIESVTDFVRRNPKHPEDRLPLPFDNEIGDLGRNMNHMLDERDRMSREIQSQQKKLFDTELLTKQMEILAYRNQINPHFLYNTLECIRGMAMVEGVDNIADIVLSLSQVMRYAVKGGSHVRIREELESIEEYLKIIRYRFSDRIRVKIDAEEDIIDYYVIKFLLQPLVENSVFHGLEPKLDGGTVWISIHRDRDSRGEEQLVFIVRDDGLGITAEREKEIREFINTRSLGEEDGAQSIGIVNIYQRLKLTYGDHADMDFRSGEDGGTEVEIHIRIDDNVRFGGGYV